MIDIDKYAYTSRLKKTDPREKIFFSLLILGTCLWANSIVISLTVILIMMSITVIRGGIPPGIFANLLKVPIFFLLLSVITIAVNITDQNDNYVIFWHIYGYYIGASHLSLVASFNLFFKALGCVSCMYYLSLNTPMVDLLTTLHKLKVPSLFVELTGLIYRFIFILLDTANNIFTAQNSRLGYSSLTSAYRSLAILASKIFIRAYKRSDLIYTALESRCYDGELRVLEETFVCKKSGYIFPILIAIVLITTNYIMKKLTLGYL